MNTALEIIKLCTENDDNNGFKLDISNLFIPLAEITAVIGANGCGKSTLLETCLGLRQSSERELSILGIVSNNENHINLSKIAFAGQNQSYPEGLSVREIIRLNNAFNESEPVPFFDTSDFDSQKFTKLSSGQRCRVLLRVALDNQPKLVLLDEPESGLDETGLSHLMIKLIERKDKGLSTIMATHHADLLSIAHYVVIMEQGGIAFQGLMKACLNEYIGPHAIELVPASPGDTTILLDSLTSSKGVLHARKTKDGRILATGDKQLLRLSQEKSLTKNTASIMQRATQPHDILTLIGDRR